MARSRSSGRVFAIVTGASRGFGKCVAEELVRKVVPHDPIDIVLVARSRSGLQKAAQAIEHISKSVGHAENVNVRREVMDLGELGTLEGRLQAIFADTDAADYSRSVLVNNAGSILNYGPANGICSLASLKKEIDLNVTSSLWVTSHFARVFGAHRAGSARSAPEVGHGQGNNSTRETWRGQVDGNHVSCPLSVVVNVSSLLAIEHQEFWSTYAAGKAAREMFHRVIALEQRAFGALRVLNYSPGPINTDLVQQLRNSPLYVEPPVPYVDVQVSAEKCVRLALSGGFEAGARVDFFDSEPGFERQT